MNVATPNLRFKTYSKPWEVQALGKLGSFLGGGTPSTENRVYWSGDIPWVSSSDIKEGDFFGINLHRFITEDAIKNSATKKVPENSLLIVSRVGVGKFAVCRHEVCTSQDFTSFTPENCSIDFIAYQLYKNKNRLINLGQGTTIKGFTTGDLASFKLHIPEKDEQQKIANFLTSVDTKISQLTEKHRLLKDYKKGVMQQVFSQQIRFKDDDGSAFPDWEEKSLGSLFGWIRTNNLSREKLSENVTALQNIHYGDIHTKFHSQFVQIRENIPYVVDAEIGKLVSQADFCKNGDIVIADASEDYADIGKAIEIISVKESTLVAGLHTYIARPKNKFASGYLGYLFQFNGTRKQVQKLAQGVSVLGISKGNIETIKLSVPHIDEQQKIAQFLQSLDKNIDAVNEQIEQTKLFKKGLLQQMFV